MAQVNGNSSAFANAVAKADAKAASSGPITVTAKKTVGKKGTPITKSEEILNDLKKFDAAWAEKNNYGYQTPQQIAEWYTRKNQESQAGWMGYQQKLQTAAMIGQVASGIGGALGQLAGGLAKSMGGGGGGGPGDTGATAARGGGGGASGGCANGRCGQSAAATTAWQDNAGAIDARAMAASEAAIPQTTDLADTTNSNFDMAQVTQEIQMQQQTTQQEPPPPPPPTVDAGTVG